MEETKKTVIRKGGILQWVKDRIVRAWDPGWCSLWIFGDEDSAQKDLHKFFNIKEEHRR